MSYDDDLLAGELDDYDEAHDLYMCLVLFALLGALVTVLELTHGC